MIEEHGTIVELKEDNIAVVECGRSSACDHCPSVDACKMGDEQEVMLVEALNVAGGELNDRVKVVTTTHNFLMSSFMLYIIPVIALLVGAIVGQQIGESSTSYDPSVIAALFGSLCLIVSFLLIRFFTRKIKRENYMPKIVAVER